MTSAFDLVARVRDEAGTPTAARARLRNVNEEAANMLCPYWAAPKLELPTRLQSSTVLGIVTGVANVHQAVTALESALRPLGDADEVAVGVRELRAGDGLGALLTGVPVGTLIAPFHIKYSSWLFSRRAGRAGQTLEYDGWAGVRIIFLKPAHTVANASGAYTKLLGAFVRWCVTGRESFANVRTEKQETLGAKVARSKGAIAEIHEAARAQREADGELEPPELTDDEILHAECMALLLHEADSYDEFTARAIAKARQHPKFWKQYKRHMEEEWAEAYTAIRSAPQVDEFITFLPFIAWQMAFWIQLALSEPRARRIFDLTACRRVGKSNVFVQQITNPRWWKSHGLKFPGVFMAESFERVKDFVAAWKGERIVIFDFGYGKKAKMSESQAELVELLSDEKRNLGGSKYQTTFKQVSAHIVILGNEGPNPRYEGKEVWAMTVSSKRGFAPGEPAALLPKNVWNFPGESPTELPAIGPDGKPSGYLGTVADPPYPGSAADAVLQQWPHLATGPAQLAELPSPVRAAVAAWTPRKRKALQDWADHSNKPRTPRRLR